MIRRSTTAVLAGWLALAAVPGSGSAASQPPPEGPAAPGVPAPPAGAALSQEDAVALALRQSPTLEIARRELNVALIEGERNRPAFRPNVVATASQVLRTPRVDLPGRRDEVILPNSVSRLEIGLRQPLYQFGAGTAPLDRANAIEAAARTDYRKAELDTVLQVREAYLALQRAQALGEVARRGRELAGENVRLTRLLQGQGFQAEVDVLEAERAEAAAESGLLQARNGAVLARANLNRLLGRELAAPLDTAPAGQSMEAPATLEELTARAVARRPEVLRIQQNIRAAEAGIRLAKASGLPRVSLEAQYALQTETVLTPRSGFAAGVSVSMPLFDGGVRRFSVREAEERAAQLQSALRAQIDGVALEIERQRLALEEASARHAVAVRAIAAAEKVYEITRLRLERGRAVQAEILRARLALEQALADRAAALNDQQVARARLDRALGDGPAAPSAGQPAPGSRE